LNVITALLAALLGALFRFDIRRDPDRSVDWPISAWNTGKSSSAKHITLDLYGELNSHDGTSKSRCNCWLYCWLAWIGNGGAEGHTFCPFLHSCYTVQTQKRWQRMFPGKHACLSASADSFDLCWLSAKLSQGAPIPRKENIGFSSRAWLGNSR
jgi:hypothetical protein